MSAHQTPQIFKKPFFLVFLLLCVFAVKGVVLTILFPFFQGPDEQIHYPTIQHLAEPLEKNWPIYTLPKDHKNKIDDITSLALTEESIRTAQLTEFDSIHFWRKNTQTFSLAPKGSHEDEITGNIWKRYVDTYPASTSGTVSFYYLIGAEIEKWLAEQSILTRFFSMRILAVLLGIPVVWLGYLTARKMNFSQNHSLLIAGLIAFQPMFSAAASQVNIDIALILAFSLFTYTAVSLLTDGLKWPYILLLIFSLVLGFFAKGPGIVLVPVTLFLFITLLYLRFSHKKARFFWWLFSLAVCCIILTVAFVPRTYLISITNFGATSKFNSSLTSLGSYIEKSLDSKGVSTHKSYWGNFGWLDTQMSESVFTFLSLIEWVAFIGIIGYLVFRSFVTKTAFLRTDGTVSPWKKSPAFLWGIRPLREKDASFLPEKKYILFFIGIIIALQLAIRFYDWRVFDATGQILIGTPGRYFLPNIIPHIFLLVTGLGFFTQNKKQFTFLLKTLFILMVLLSLYAIFNVILPRYYL